MARALSWYAELSEAKGRREHGCFLLEGFRAISQAIAADHSSVSEILIREGVELPFEVGCPVRVLSAVQLKKIAQTQTPQGAVAIVRIPPGSSGGELPPVSGGDILLCEHVQDPGNAGSLIRTAAAFGFEGVLLSAQSADPFSPRCAQATAGTLLSMWIRRTGDCAAAVRELQSRGYVAVAASTRADTGLQWPDSKPVVLIAGNEGAGISQELTDLADMRISIPIERERAESLNVAAAGAICMHSLAARRTR